MAFCSAALLGPGGSALGLTGFPFGMQSEGPTLSTPSSAGGTVVAVAAEATGCVGCCCCSTATVTKPWLRIRALGEAVKKSPGKKTRKGFDNISLICHPILPDRSFGHLPIFHPSCWGRKRGCRGGGGRQRRGGGGRGRHRDNGGCGGCSRTEGGDGDLLGLGGIFTTVWTEEHAAVVRSAAPSAQHRHATAVEAVSDALVRAALEKRALKEKKKGGFKVGER